MNLKNTISAGVLALGTLNACGDHDVSLECGRGIQNVQLATWEEVWRYCGNQYSYSRENNPESYVTCAATCSDGSNCEKKVDCHTIIYGDAKALRNYNNCTGNGSAVCYEKID